MAQTTEEKFQCKLDNCFHCGLKKTSDKGGLAVVTMRYRSGFVVVCVPCDTKIRKKACSHGVRDTDKWGDYRVLGDECRQKALYQDPPCCGDHAVCERCGDDLGYGCYHENHPSYRPFKDRYCDDCEGYDRSAPRSALW